MSIIYPFGLVREDRIRTYRSRWPNDQGFTPPLLYRLHTPSCTPVFPGCQPCGRKSNSLYLIRNLLLSSPAECRCRDSNPGHFSSSHLSYTGVSGRPLKLAFHPRLCSVRPPRHTLYQKGVAGLSRLSVKIHSHRGCCVSTSSRAAPPFLRF